MLGLPRGEVFLVPWTSEWEKEFELEKKRIKDAIGQSIMNVHHIGSTAVKNLSAKPILDIAIEIEDFNNGVQVSFLLERLGYSYKGTNILPERHYLIKGEPRTHQIHLYQSGSKYLLEQLKFRNQLRDNDKERLEYEQLKLKLAEANKDNKHNYAEAKTAFIKSVLAIN